MPVYEIYEYKYRVHLFFCVFFYAREDKTANEMKELYEKGMNKHIKLIHKRKKYIKKPPYEWEQEQLEILRRETK